MNDQNQENEILNQQLEQGQQLQQSMQMQQGQIQQSPINEQLMPNSNKIFFKDNRSFF